MTYSCRLCKYQTNSRASIAKHNTSSQHKKSIIADEENIDEYPDYKTMLEYEELVSELKQNDIKHRKIIEKQDHEKKVIMECADETINEYIDKMIEQYKECSGHLKKASDILTSKNEAIELLNQQLFDKDKYINILTKQLGKKC